MPAPPPRHRTRPPTTRRDLDLGDATAPRELRSDEQVLRDLEQDVLTDRLPQQTADRVRVMAARRSPEVMAFIYESIYKMRMTGLRWIDIAHHFRVHEQTVYKWFRASKDWLKERHTKLDPAYHYAQVMEANQQRRTRLLAQSEMINLSDEAGNAIPANLAVWTRIQSELTRLNEDDRRWMDKYGYFDLFPFGKLLGQDADSAEAKAKMLRDILEDVFSDDEDELDPADLDGWDDEDDLPV